MKRTILISLLMLTMWGGRAVAQGQFELTCPTTAAGELSRPMPFSVTYNPLTNRYRANWCTDSTGLSYWNGNVTSAGFPLLAPAGTAAAPSYAFAAAPGIGWWSNTNGIQLSILGTESWKFDVVGGPVNSLRCLVTNCSLALGGGTINGISANEVGIGTTQPAAQGNSTGTLDVGNLTHTTLTNRSVCNVNGVSPAACASQSTGLIVVPTTTTTYTINTTLAIGGSRIFLQPSTQSASFSGSPTCVAPASGPIVSGLASGVSFTFTLPSTAGTTCFYWWIEN